MSRQGDGLLSMRIEITEPGNKADMRSLSSFYTMRSFPSMSPGIAPLREFCKVSLSNYRVKEFWAAKVLDFRLGEAPNEELEYLRPKEILNAFYIEHDWTQPDGAEVISFE